MSDRLFLNLWFPQFEEPDMVARSSSVARQFPFSPQRPGISFMAVHAVSYSEPMVFQQTFEVGADVDRVFLLASEFVHSDYAYEFEMYWDMWVPDEAPESYEGLETMWRLEPQQVHMAVHGTDFEDHLYQEAGHVQFELGLDSTFLAEDIALDIDGEQRIKSNIAKLVEFTNAIEKNCGISGRVLWSESEERENLAQKLISRLQRVQ
jgi:hypothetical protein